MNIDLKWTSHETNWWVLKSWDFNVLGVVKVFNIKCCKESGGDKYIIIYLNIKSTN